MIRARPATERRRYAAGFRWLLAGVSACLCLGAAELVLRVLELPRQAADFQFVRPDGELDQVFASGGGMVADPELFWRMAPGQVPRAALVNRHGLRGYWPERAKGPRDLRIACIGDSCTYGLGVSYDATYGVLLEQRLQQALPDRCVQASLLAFPGYSTHQSRVLVARHLVELAPDVVILYFGAWNDYLPAVVHDDQQRARRATRSLRLHSLLDRLTEPGDEQFAFFREEFRAGRAPCGRRVPLPQFRANMLAILAAARELGSAPILVVPPVPESTRAAHPIGAEYRDCVQELAASEGVPMVDAEALFAAQAGESLFLDWVHPTARGHRLLAEALAPLVQKTLRPLPSRPATTLRVDRVEPDVVAVMTPTLVTLHGRGLGEPGAFDRVFVGDRWQPEARCEPDRIELYLQRVIPPGRHRLYLQTATGLVDAGELTVGPAAPFPVRAEVVRGPGLRIRVHGEAPVEAAVAVWLAPARRGTPRATPIGPFELDSGELAGLPEPLDLTALPLPRYLGVAGGFRTFTVDCPVPAELERAAAPVYLQVALFDPEDQTFGALSEAVSVPLAR